MAAAASEIEHRQAGYHPGRDGISGPFPRGKAFEKGTFLDTLDPELPRPPAVKEGTLLDTSFLEQSMLEVDQLATQPERRIRAIEQNPAWGEMGTIVFSEPHHVHSTAKTGNIEFREVGQNIYRHPYDEQWYPGPRFVGTQLEVPGLFPNLRTLIYEGGTTIFSYHRQLTSPIPSISDMLIVRVRQRKEEETLPIVTGIGTFMEDGQVVTLATDKTPGVLPDNEIKEERIKLEEKYVYAGGKDQVRWERKLGLMTEGSRRYRREKRQFDEFIREARNEQLAEVADTLALQFYWGKDMRRAKAMPIRTIMRGHWEEQQAA